MRSQYRAVGGGRSTAHNASCVVLRSERLLRGRSAWNNPSAPAIYMKGHYEKPHIARRAVALCGLVLAMNADLYERVARALAAVRCDVDAAECHGMLCGMLSGPRAFEPGLWLDHVSGGEREVFASGEPRAALESLMRETLRAMGAEDYQLALLLPADEVPLTARAAGFASWCRGFLSGLGLAGIADLEALGEDAREFLADLSRFTALAMDADGDEEDERALVELTEFTRMGVMLVRAELKAGDSDEDDKVTLH